MISKSDRQLIRQIHRKRMREETGLFLVEGVKMVRELLSLPATTSFRITLLAGTSEWINKDVPGALNPPDQIEEISQKELSQLSQMQAPQQVLALVRLPEILDKKPSYDQELVLGLDDVQDPGNVGTILRSCDWFGINSIIAGSGTADFFNPKVVQASMGSIFRLQLFQQDLLPYIQQITPDTPIYGAELGGESIYRQKLESRGVLLMGNESKGIRQELGSLITQSISIPAYSNDNHAESLNVAVATAIICAEFMRQANG